MNKAEAQKIVDEANEATAAYKALASKRKALDVDISKAKAKATGLQGKAKAAQRFLDALNELEGSTHAA